jgi:hypothetical protein
MTRYQSIAQPEVCPGCGRELKPGEQVYRCEKCEDACCTACSETTALFDVLCVDCYFDSPTQKPA